MASGPRWRQATEQHRGPMRLRNADVYMRHWQARSGDTHGVNAHTVDRILPLLDSDGVLGLGESTHGSANVFEWKFDVVCELASRGLLRAFAFEESFMVGLEVDRALRGDGDLHVAWRDAMGVWKTQAIVDGLRRLQRINSRLPVSSRVRFIGIDSKSPHLAAAALLDAGYANAVLKALAERRELDHSEIAEAQRACASAACDADQRTAGAARQILRRIDAYDLEPGLGRLHRRDTHMAETLLENLPERGITVLWAHNEHIARNPDFFGGPSVGQVLADRIGTRYTSIGVLCGEGSCRAIDPSTGDPDYRSVELPRSYPDTTDVALESLQIDFAPADKFSHPGPRRFIGWSIDHAALEGLDRGSFESARPSADFDALAYLPESIADTTWKPPNKD